MNLTIFVGTVAWLSAVAPGMDVEVVCTRMPTHCSEAIQSTFKQARADYKSGQVADAKRAMEKLVRVSPDFGLAHYYLGLATEALQPRSADALSFLMRARDLEPENARLHYAYADALQKRGHYQSALAVYEEALLIRGRYPDAILAKAQCLENMKRFDEAIAVYEAFKIMMPRELPAHSALAHLYEEVGDFQRAEASWTAIIRLQPQTAYVHYAMAAFYERSGEGSRAKRLLRQAERLDPQKKRKMRRLR